MMGTGNFDGFEKKKSKKQAEEDTGSIGFIDPLLNLPSLRDTKLIKYYSSKIAAQRNEISPAYGKSDVEIAKEDPYSVLSDAQRIKMDHVRESMKVELHNAAIEELRLRRMNAAQRRKMKR